MSRWLQNVGTFLERLDDTAERVAEEKDEGDFQDDHAAAGNIESILAARGLSETLKDHDDDDDDDEAQDENGGGDNDTLDEEQVGRGESQLYNNNHESTPVAVSSKETPETTVEARVEPEESVPELSQEGWDAEDLSENINNMTENSDYPEQTRPIEEVSQDDPTSLATEQVANQDSSSMSLPPPESTTENPEQTETAAVEETKEMENIYKDKQRPLSAPVSAEDHVSIDKESAPSTAEAKLPSLFTVAAAPILAAASSSSSAPPAQQPRRGSKKPPPTTTENQKELRTLRRSVVSLNQQLESAEAELRAQREELERAAERMEKDRLRQKEEREKERKQHASDIKAMQQQNEQALKEAKMRADKQMEQIREQLREVEDKRMQEGGDWNKELVDAVAREKEMGEKLRYALEEKDTLLSQITILQNQQESLGSRLESLSQTADNAMEREREADQRFDEALTLHAKQISQRQAREAELERTIAELGQALVQARNRVPSSKVESENGDDHARLESAEHEIESLRNQLQYETQRASSLQSELEAQSNERTQEATTTHRQQRQHEREVDDLKHKISRLENELREFQSDPESGRRASISAKDDQENLRQIKQLSEEVIRQREKITNSSSEISALKSRLKVATERASNAESALELSQSGDGDSQDLEVAPGMRRRRRGRSPKPATIRSALQLDTFAQHNSTEQIGKALDGLDSFLLQSGKILRYQPLARLLFILYLVMIHLWTFFLIFVHAHGYETVHGDFGAGHGVPHGPHALMMHNPQVEPAAAAAAGGGVEQQAYQHN